MQKPSGMTQKRWRRIQKRRENRAVEAIMCGLMREIFIDEAFDKAVKDYMDKWDAGEIPPLTPEEELVLEKSRVKLMASLNYHRNEGVFQKPINQ